MWIIVGWYNDDWWKKPDVKCKGEQMLEAAANLIETLPLPLSTSRQPTISTRVCSLRMKVSQYSCFWTIPNIFNWPFSMV